MHSNRLLSTAFCSFVCLALVAGRSEAGVITPSYDSFGTLPGATFGGTGIPNDAVAITTIVDGSRTITLGLTAHARFSEPTVTNDGAGTFFAEAGEYPDKPALARWNFAFFAEVVGAQLAEYNIEMLYDTDPGIGTLDTDLGRINISNFSALNGFQNPMQDSVNLGFPGLQMLLPFLITPPTYGDFNPNAVGQYSFSLRASRRAGEILGESAINVNVVEAVPEPSTLAIFAIGICGTVGVIRRRRAGGI